MVTGARDPSHRFSDPRSGRSSPAGRIARVNPRSSRARWTAALVLAFVPVVYLVSEVSRFYLDVPYWDEWSLAPLVSRQAAGESIPLVELAAFHNEHRPLLPRLGLLALARHSHWATWPGVVTGLLIGMAGVLAALRVLALMTRARGGVDWWAVPAVSALMLSMNQWENWLWQWQVAIFVTVLLLFVCLALLGRSPLGPGRVFAAAIAAAAASFSFGNGLLLWPAGLVLVWTNGGPRRVLWVLAWSACACGVGYAYFHGFPRSAPVTAWPGAVHALADVARYLGAPLANHLARPWTVACGAAGLAAFAACCWRARGTSAWTMALALAIFAVGSGALLALGRGTFLAGASVPPKYLAFANVFWVALLGLTLAAFTTRVAAAAVATVITVGVAMTAVQARPLYLERYRELAGHRFALYSAESESALRGFFPVVTYLRQVLPELRERRLAHFDCDDPVTRRDWVRIVSALSDRARAGDRVVTSTDWAAACLSAALASAREPALEVVSAGESSAQVRALAGSPGTFLLSAGDVRAPDARQVMQRAHLLSGGERNPLRLYYWPDRTAYLAQRLSDRELEADSRVFPASLLGDAATRFLLDGWNEPEVQHGQTVRRTAAAVARVYVPVLERAPQRVHLDASAGSMAAPLVLRVDVNGTPAGAMRVEGGWHADTLDLSRAAWRPGGNVLALVVSFAEGAPREPRAPVAILRRLELE